MPLSVDDFAVKWKILYTKFKCFDLVKLENVDYLISSTDNKTETMHLQMTFEYFSLVD